MTLLIPNRKAPAESSFPTAPAAVAKWVDGLHPLSSNSSRRTLYRGLKHTNRLENNNHKRVEILGILEPAIDEVLDSLFEQYREQPLPLHKRPANAHQLASDLLQELGFAWKIVVNDTYATLLSGQSGLRNIALFRAMRVLAKTVLHHSLIYSPVPEGVMHDANTLYKLAEESALHDQLLSLHELDDEQWSIKHAYAHIQLLSMACLHCQRSRQIPLLSNFLELAAENIDLGKPGRQSASLGSHYAIHLEQDVMPSKWHYLLPGLRRHLRVFDTEDLLDRIRRAEKAAPESVSREQEGERLNRRSFAILGEMLSRELQRSENRQIANRPVTVESGLKEIVANFSHARNRNRDPDSSPSLQNWSIVNESKTGCSLRWHSGSPSALQVGELIAITDTRDTNPSGKEFIDNTRLGLIHWIQNKGKSGLTCGVEKIPGQASAVLVDGLTDSTRGSRIECLSNTLNTDNGKFRYLITPSLAYHESCSVRVYRDDSSSDWIMRQKLLGTGAFDRYQLARKAGS